MYKSSKIYKFSSTAHILSQTIRMRRYSVDLVITTLRYTIQISQKTTFLRFLYRFVQLLYDRRMQISA